jgi:hypothetical protein
VMHRRVVLVVCLGIYAAGALIGFDDYGKICLSADRVLWHGEGGRSLHAPAPAPYTLQPAYNLAAVLPLH